MQQSSGNLRILRWAILIIYITDGKLVHRMSEGTPRNRSAGDGSVSGRCQLKLLSEKAFFSA